MSKERIASISLDDGNVKKRSPEIEHERSTAIADLLHENKFSPMGLKSGPYDIRLRVEDGRLAFTIKGKTKKSKRVVLSVLPFKPIVRDYFLICESYYEAIKKNSRNKIEALDAGRRAVHNEGAELLQSLLADSIAIDFTTARRLFTLLSVLHLKQ